MALTIREHVTAEGRNLLLGGSKRTQRSDIRGAKGFWREYLEAKHDGKT
jgi:hypothetical protein